MALRGARLAGRLRAMLAPRSTALALAIGLALAAPGRARAQGSPAPDYAAAKRHYDTAERASAAGDHAVAAREYLTAYDITKDPILFFKIGQAYDKAGDCRSAITYYQRYIGEANPTADYKQRTEELVTACRSRTASSPPASSPPADATTTASRANAGITAPAPPPVEPTPAPPAPVEPAPAPPVEQPPAPPVEQPAPTEQAADRELVGPPTFLDPETSWQRTAAWSSVGLALALGTTAAVLGLSAVSREEDINNLITFRDLDGQPAVFTGTTADRYRDLVDEGKRLETLAIAALAATGAATAAAVVFFVLDARAEPAAPVAPTLTDGGAGVTWSGSF